MLTSRIPVAAALLSLSLLTVFGTGCSKNDAAESTAPAAPGAPGAAGSAGSASEPPQAAAAAAEASRAAAAQQRMNEEMAKGRAAAEAAGNK